MSEPDPFVRLVEGLNRAGVRFVLIGVAGANHYALSGSTIFTTEDYDLFAPADAENALAAWQVCESLGFNLWCGDEPLDRPRDRFLAEQIVARRGQVRIEAEGLLADLTMVMAGFDFASVWQARRTFRIGGVDVPVARLSHIVASKAAAGRPKDRLFLATHEESLREFLKRDED